METYNGGKFLREQLESLNSQTFLPFELVITDDGSQDETLRTIEEFSRVANFPMRLYINPKRLGFVDNFLYCSSLCNGNLIAFCDQDDYWLSNNLSSSEKSNVIGKKHIQVNDVAAEISKGITIPNNLLPKDMEDITAEGFQEFTRWTEQLYFDHAYTAVNQNKKKLAEYLNVSRDFLHRKLKGLGIGIANADMGSLQ